MDSAKKQMYKVSMVILMGLALLLPPTLTLAGEKVGNFPKAGKIADGRAYKINNGKLFLLNKKGRSKAAKPGSYRLKNGQVIPVKGGGIIVMGNVKPRSGDHATITGKKKLNDGNEFQQERPVPDGVQSNSAGGKSKMKPRHNPAGSHY